MESNTVKTFPSDRIYKPGQLVQHYKTGDLYAIVSVAQNTEDPGSVEVGYISITTYKSHSRNLSMFSEDIELEDGRIPRFNIVGTARITMTENYTDIVFILTGVGSPITHTISIRNVDGAIQGTASSLR